MTYVIQQCQPSIKVPIRLILSTFRSKSIKPSHLRTYLFLKFLYQDRFNVSLQELDNMALSVGINIKTLNSHLEVLIKNNWIGWDKKNNRIYIRSKYKIADSTILTKLQVEVSMSDLNNFNAFCLGAIVGYLGKCYRYKISNKPEPPNAGSLTGYIRKQKYLKHYAPLGVNYLAKVLNRCKSWIDKYKQKAIAIGYIKRRRDFIDPNLKYEQRDQFLKHNDLLKGRARFKLVSKVTNGTLSYEGRLVIVAIDLLFSPLNIRR